MKLKRRTNLLSGKAPRVVFAVMWWVIIGLIIFRVDPLILENGLVKGIHLPFILSVMMAVGGGIWVFSKWWRAVLWGSLVGIYLILRRLELGSLINAILLILLGGVVEYVLHPISRDEEARKETDNERPIK